MNRTFKIILSIALIYGCWTFLIRPNMGSQGFYDPENTAQQEYKLTLLEPYSGIFRVMSREDYFSGEEAKISPVDFALGWGPMSDPQVYKQLNIEQRNRWYYWRTSEQPPIPIAEINRHSANTHLIPANKTIAEQLKKIRRDDLIRLKGHLVEVKAQNGFTWRSSLSREDTGNGACELMLVEDVQLISSL